MATKSLSNSINTQIKASIQIPHIHIAGISGLNAVKKGSVKKGSKPFFVDNLDKCQLNNRGQVGQSFAVLVCGECHKPHLAVVCRLSRTLYFLSGFIVSIWK